MAPPLQNLNLDVEAISGICGSISIACWVVVFSPQIVENFRRSSADGLSLQFIIVWLAGDVFNILGAILQGVLPTMIILAIYYTLADIVLLGQCFYYRGFTFRDEVVPPPKKTTPPAIAINGTQATSNETTRLLNPNNDPRERERRSSTWSNVDATHLSPATPLLDAGLTTSPPPKPTSALRATLFNLFAVLIVCLAGFLGWWISQRSGSPSHPRHHCPKHDPLSSILNNSLLSLSASKDTPSPPNTNNDLELNLWGQIFGYLCAILYLASRLPQLLLNYRRKSTSGVSILFFLFACIGNLTYVLSIFIYEGKCSGKIVKGTDKPECAPGEAAALYGRYMLVNASWLAGSLGTLFLDMGIFAQFFMYRDQDEDTDDDETAVDSNGNVNGDGNGVNGQQYDDRPLLQRGDSIY